MTRGSAHRQQGFSLLEVLVALSLFTITLSAIMMTFNSNRRSYIRGGVKMDVQQSARLALSAMTTQIRMTGYLPENFATTPPSPLLTNAVQIATNDALAVHGDLDGTGTSAVYLYCLDGTTLRGGRAPNSDTSAYWCAAGDVLAEGVTSLRFDYFDEDNTPIPATAAATFQLDSQAVGTIPTYTTVTQRDAVRRVVMTMTVTHDVPSQTPQSFYLGSEVVLRNVR